MAFWGSVVKPGKAQAFVPPPEDWNLHLSQATLEPTVPEGKRVAVTVKSDPEEEPLLICTLTAGRVDTVNLDLFFSQYSEFSVIGDHPVHLTGYYTPPQTLDDEEDDEDEDGEDEDDEEYQPAALGYTVQPGVEDGSDEDEDEDEDDDDDEDEEGDEDDEDGLLMADGDDDEMFGFDVVSAAAVRRKKPHVVIEDVTDEADNKRGKEGKGQKKAEAMADEDEDEEGEDDEDEEGEDDEEEEEKPPAKVGTKREMKLEAPAAKKQAVGQQQPQPAAAKGKEDKQQQQQAKQQQAQPKPEPKQQQAKPEAPKPKQEQQQKQAQQQKQEGKAEKKKNIRRHPNGFEIEDVSMGNPKGKLAKPGSKVLVRYTGRLKTNGKVFDKSGNKPFQFRLGVGEVIKGWDAGVDGMRVGDKRRLVIPPQMAYGTSGVKGTIPPNAILEFDVELVDVK